MYAKSADIKLKRDGSYYAEILPMTYGKHRIVWTDGLHIDLSW